MNQFGNKEGVGLSLLVVDDEGEESDNPFYVEASLGCGNWNGVGPPHPNPRPFASSISAFGLLLDGAEDSILLVPNDAGEFDSEELQRALDLLNTNDQFMAMVATDEPPAVAPTTSPIPGPPTVSANAFNCLSGWMCAIAICLVLV